MTTFTRTSPGTFDATTNTFSGGSSTSTLTGNAIQVKGNPQRYKALGLSLETNVTLFFSELDYNLRAFTTDFVQPGDTLSWNDQTYSVIAVDPIAIDGIVIAARVITGN